MSSLRCTKGFAQYLRQILVGCLHHCHGQRMQLVVPGLQPLLQYCDHMLLTAMARCMQFLRWLPVRMHKLQNCTTMHRSSLKGSPASIARSAACSSPLPVSQTSRTLRLCFSALSRMAGMPSKNICPRRR